MKMTVMPLRDEAPQGLEQLAALLRGEHRGRLVEDDDAGAAGENLEDLDALLDADRKQADPLGRVDPQAELARQAPGRARSGRDGR